MLVKLKHKNLINNFTSQKARKINFKGRKIDIKNYINTI